MGFIKKAPNALLNMLFPPHCRCCGQLINAGEVCDACGEELAGSCVPRFAVITKQMAPSLTHVDEAYACYLYRGAVKQALLNVKFNGRAADAPFLAQRMKRFAQSALDLQSFNYVVSVPKYGKNTKNVDVSYVLCQYLTKNLYNIYKKNLLYKVKHTMPQHMLDKVSRGTNLNGAFKAGNVNLNGKSVLVVDDIFTTGNTLNECAKALKAGGAAKVCGAVLCYTEPGRMED